MTMERGRKNPWGSGRVAFFLYRDAIQRALDEGHSMAAIHRQHADALGIGYDQFANYVGQYLRRPAAGRAAVRKRSDDAPNAAPCPPPIPTSHDHPVPAQEHTPRRATPERRRGFFVDPMAMRTKNLI